MLDEAAQQPQIEARELLVGVDDPVLGRIDVIASSPIKYAKGDERACLALKATPSPSQRFVISLSRVDGKGDVPIRSCQYHHNARGSLRRQLSHSVAVGPEKASALAEVGEHTYLTSEP
jgi:hypothetical protein